MCVHAHFSYSRTTVIDGGYMFWNFAETNAFLLLQKLYQKSETMHTLSYHSWFPCIIKKKKKKKQNWL